MREDALRQQRGMVLVLSLVFLLLFAVIAAALLQSGQLELRMAGNSESVIRDRQRALAVLELLLEQPGIFAARERQGYRFCAPGDPGPGCDEFSLSPVSVLPVALQPASARIERVGPLAVTLPAMHEALASSAVAFAATRFELWVATGEIGQRRTELAQGVMRRVPGVAP